MSAHLIAGGFVNSQSLQVVSFLQPTELSRDPIQAGRVRALSAQVKGERGKGRIIYRIDDDTILIIEVFNKTTRGTPASVIENCFYRLSKYDRDKHE